MGLLDVFDTYEGQQALGLLAAGGPRTDPNQTGFGTRMQDAMGSANAWKKAKAEDEFRKMQMEEARAAMLDRQRKQAQDEAMRKAAQGAVRSPEMANAMSQGPMPDGGNMPTVKPGFDSRKFLNSAYGIDPMAAMDYESKLSKDKPLINVAQGSTLYDPNTNQSVFTSPKEAAPTELSRLMTEMSALPPDSPMRRVYQQQISKITTHAPGTSVSINNGQKGFDNTLKLRADFRGEPIYKAHQDVQSAYAQIQEGLKMQSPAGDLAGATKIMKLLDPGSVVRESELGMAMAATGALDRLMNYSDRVIKGTKLTPNQRQDFQKLADALYQESGKQYNTKRGEYQGIAERNGLSVPDVLGAEFKEVKPDKPSNRPQIPQKAINELKLRGPGYKAQFDAAFGAGAADSVLGGR